MSELNNPLFENQKEFLERQKEEYKNALLSDVTDLKTQSQQVGKTLLIAGGAIAGVWFLSSMFRGKKKDKKSKRLKTGSAGLALPPGTTTIPSDAVVRPDGSLNYQDALHQDTGYATYHYEPQHQNTSMVQSLLHSDLAKALSQQVTAFLMLYITKKIEEYLVESKNTDIASSKEPVTKDIDFSYHEEDAV